MMLKDRKLLSEFYQEENKKLSADLDVSKKEGEVKNQVISLLCRLYVENHPSCALCDMSVQQAESVKKMSRKIINLIKYRCDQFFKHESQVQGELESRSMLE